MPSYSAFSVTNTTPFPTPTAAAREPFRNDAIRIPSCWELSNHLERAARRSARFAVLVVELERFKTVRDALGRETADQLLRRIASRLRTGLPRGVRLARLAGGRFAILLDRLPEEMEAVRAGEWVGILLTVPFNLDGLEVYVDARVGVALSMTGYDQPADLLCHAETALHHARRQGASHEVFGPAMLRQAAASFELENDLRQVLERQQLQLRFQPIVDLDSHRILGMEALVRWQHARHGLLLPEDFLEAAKAIGMLTAIDRWVLAEACRQLAAWHRDFPHLHGLTISVNVEAERLASGTLLEEVQEALRTNGLPPSALKLEITEGTRLEATPAVKAAVSRLAMIGVGLQIDDFGAGYSSLCVLPGFPGEALKIDRSFIAGLTGSLAGHAEIVRSIAELAHNLGMRVIAEGVETVNQLEAVRALGCDDVQGFLLSEPLDPDTVQILLSKQAPSTPSVTAQ